jgi:hypothetical protein
VIVDLQLYALFLTAALLLTLAPDAISGLPFVGLALRLMLVRRKAA